MLVLDHLVSDSPPKVSFRGGIGRRILAFFAQSVIYNVVKKKCFQQNMVQILIHKE